MKLNIARNLTCKFYYFKTNQILNSFKILSKRWDKINLLSNELPISQMLFVYHFYVYLETVDLVKIVKT